MKKILFSSLILISSYSFSQSTINPPIKAGADSEIVKKDSAVKDTFYYCILNKEQITSIYQYLSTADVKPSELDKVKQWYLGIWKPLQQQQPKLPANDSIPTSKPLKKKPH